MKKPPTDLQVLEEIYKRYYPTFTSFSRGDGTRSAKVYVPIDIKAIAGHFGTDPDIVFGRLHYYLDPKYGFVQPDGTKVSFFSIQVGSDRHCIQFPLLGAAIARLREERNQYLLATVLSIVAIAISLASFAVSMLSKFRH